MRAVDKFVPQPDLAEVAATNVSLSEIPAPTMTLEVLQAIRQAPQPQPELRHQVETRVLPGPNGDIPVRIIRPTAPPVAVVISLHSGGWCFNTPAVDDWLNDILAQECQVAAVAVDYRLAPENPYPAALDDVVAVTRWLVEHSPAEFGTERLLIMGSSAGAHLGAELLLALRDHHPDILRLVQAAGFSYGAYDIGKTPSMRLVADDALVVTRDAHEQFLDYSFPGLDPEGRRDPSISPLYADLTGLPPALFTAAALDPLLDDTLFMAARWEAAGNSADLDVWPECVHAFDAYSPVTGRAYADRLASWFNAHLVTS